MSSLFGTFKPQAPTAPSLFTNNTTTSSQQPSSLFGATTNQSAASSGTTGAGFGSSLFSSTNHPSGNSLFGNTTNAASGGGSLFAPPTQPATSQPQAPSLFGQSSANVVNANQPQAQGDSQGQVVRNAEGPRVALFENLLERGKKRREPTSSDMQSAQLPSLQLGLGDISSKIRGLGTTKPDFKASRAGDSRAHYLLAASGVPQGATRRDLDALGIPSVAIGQADELQVDTNIETYVNNLQAKTTRQLMQESLEQSKRDFDAFVEDHIQFNLDEQRRRVYEHFGLVRPDEDREPSASGGSVEPTARGGFSKSSQRNRGFGATGGNGMRSSFGASGMSKSILGGSVSRNSVRQQELFTDVAEAASAVLQATAQDDPFQRSKQEKYAGKVTEFNITRATERLYPLIEEFARVEIEGGTDTPKHLIDAYRALKDIVGETSAEVAPTHAISQRQYAKQYLDESSNSASAMHMRRRILKGSRQFLESSFYRDIEGLVDRNAREADVGGLPTKISKVRGYVRIRSNRKDLGADTYELQMLGDDHCWVLIFYLLRCGLIKEAAQYVAENERAIMSMDRRFPEYMASYAGHERDMPRGMQQRMNAEYTQRAKLAPEKSIDPYRMACYKIIGRCDLNRKNLDGVSADIEDLIWLYFCLAREANKAEEAAGEVFGLEDVRNVIDDIGDRWFSPESEGGPAYATFFLMQILSGMFEKAIAWLYPHNYVAATHFAIALDYYGLLRVSDPSATDTNLLTYNTRQKPQISFGRLLGYYTRDFRQARAGAAADYLILICINADLPGEIGKSQAEMCHEALKELVLETREFALLLGDIGGDGRREPGVIERRLPLLNDEQKRALESLQTLTIQAAAVADDSGRITDAVLLFHLAEDYESVMTTVNKALSDALHVEVGQEQLRLQPLKPRPAPQAGGQGPAPGSQNSMSLTSIDDPVELAHAMKRVYDGNGLALQKISNQTMDAANTLLGMAEVKRNIEDQRWASAVDSVGALGILPLDARGNMNLIRSAAQGLNAQPSIVSSNIGNLLIWAHIACGRQRQYLRQSVFDVGRNAEVEQLGRMSLDIQKFAGMIKHKLPPDVFNMLASAGQERGKY